MGKFTTYKLPLKTLAEGTHEFSYKLDKTFFANMENNDIRDADLDVKLVVNHHNDLYTLSFTIAGTVTLLCDRCLDDLVLPIETAYTINVQYGEDYNDDSDDLLIIPADDNYLNVAYMIYDTVVLCIPIKHVHPLGKCNRAMSALLKKHRAHGTGEDAELEDEMLDTIDAIDSGATTTDPRWNALRDIATDEPQD